MLCELYKVLEFSATDQDGQSSKKKSHQINVKLNLSSKILLSLRNWVIVKTCETKIMYL